MQVDVKLINPFIQASLSVFEMLSGKKSLSGKPSIGNKNFSDEDILIKLGVVGELNGYVILALKPENAKSVASIMMCGMPVNELDDMALSAVCELGNMIMGNAATLFSVADILTDITIPSIVKSSELSDITANLMISVPILVDGQESLVLNIIVNGK